MIRLTATRDCWVGISDNSGKQLYNGIVQAGKSMTWSEKQRVTVRIGNPSGVKLTVDGKNETPKSVNPVTVYVNPASTPQVATTGGAPVAAAAAATPTHSASFGAARRRDGGATAARQARGPWPRAAR